MLVSGLTIGVEIGSGAFGKVHLAEDPVHGEVAAKIIKREPSESEADWRKRKERLLNEAVLLKKASHAHVVPVYHLLESDVDDSILYVMEFCKSGCLLKSYEQGPMSLARVKTVGTHVALGLAELHSQGILHRDIKPSNILQFGNVHKVSDFGFATDDIVLGYASAAGYLDHLAPETHSSGITSEKSDAWALGMTIYRLMHGKLWYEKLGQPRRLVPQGDFAAKLSWLPHIPSEWRRFVRALLNDEPSERLTISEAIERLAKLSTSPSWECLTTTNDVVWNTRTADRLIEVAWNKTATSNSWIAVSKPLSGVHGRERILAKVAEKTVSKHVLRELNKFFEARHLRG